MSDFPIIFFCLLFFIILNVILIYYWAKWCKSLYFKTCQKYQVEGISKYLVMAVFLYMAFPPLTGIGSYFFNFFGIANSSDQIKDICCTIQIVFSILFCILVTLNQSPLGKSHWLIMIIKMILRFAKLILFYAIMLISNALILAHYNLIPLSYVEARLKSWLKDKALKQAINTKCKIKIYQDQDGKHQAIITSPNRQVTLEGDAIEKLLSDIENFDSKEQNFVSKEKNNIEEIFDKTIEHTNKIAHPSDMHLVMTMYADKDRQMLTQVACDPKNRFFSEHELLTYLREKPEITQSLEHFFDEERA